MEDNARTWLIPYTALAAACVPVAFFLISMAPVGGLATFVAWRGFDTVVEVVVFFMAPIALVLVLAAFIDGGSSRWRISTWVALGLALGETLPIWWIAVMVLYFFLLVVLAILLWTYGLM